MRKIIYINNDQMSIVEGKLAKDGSVNIVYQEQIALPAGTVLNGVILQKESVVETLKTYKKRLNKVTILLNSSHIITKKMMLPPLSEAQIISVLKKEFALLEQNEKYIYDFSRLSKGENHSIMACAMPESFLTRYKEIFEEAGIKVKAIDVALNGILKWAKAQVVLQDKCCVLNIMDQQTMTAILLQKGEYIFHNKTRLVGESLAPGYGAELFTSLSSMIQFNKSQKTGHSIEASYYVGIQEEVVQQLSRLVENLDDTLTVQTIPCAVKNEAFYPLGGLYKAERDINLAKGVKNRKKVYWRELRWLGKAVNTGLLAAIIVTIGFWITGVNKGYEKNIRVLEDYLVSSDVLEALGEIVALENQKIRLEDAVEAIKMTLQDIVESKVIDGETLGQVYGVAGDAITIREVNYSEDTRVLALQGSATGIHETEKLVTRLKATTLFEEVDYSGYTSQGEKYGFSIVATLKEVEAYDN
ncbi:MAG: type IV pilus biogenesis protein PilM [Cellulosilyticaceae bacterium]